MDRYRVDKVLGEGSFGKAILCTRNDDNKACVVKQVDASNPNARKTANIEATVLAKLSHPNIVGFWESFSHGLSRNIICIVMEYADGGDLHSFLQGRKGRLLEEGMVLDWFLQTTLAVKHIHDRRILHRDLKSQNIFITQSKKIKIGDFGIAKDLENTCELAPMAVGTPYYMSPEMSKKRAYDHKTDVWSLGCVLYEMTTLRHPFDGRDMQSLVLKICAHEPRPISSRYSAGLRALLGQLFKKKPRARPSPEAILRRPLMKGRIRRFLSDNQIEEELGQSFLRNPCPAAATAAGVPREDSANTSGGVQGPGRGIVGVAAGAKTVKRNKSGIPPRPPRREENRAKVKESGGGVQTRKGHLPRKVDFPLSKRTSLRTRRKPIASPPPDKNCPQAPPRISSPPAKGGHTAAPATAAEKATPPAGRRFRLGADGTWFQALEAKMAAVEKQMDQIRTPLFSTLRRRGLSAKDDARMREEADTVAKNAPREGKHDQLEDRGETVIVKYDPKVEMRSTPMPPCVEGPLSWDTVGVHQSGIEPSRSASVAPPTELEQPCETSSNAIERHQAIRSTPDGERASVRRQQQTQHERRQVENNDEEGKLAALVEMVGNRRDPTKRGQELRSFIARARRKCPTEKSDLDVQKGDGVSMNPAKDDARMREEADTVAKNAPREGDDERDAPGETVIIKYDPKVEMRSTPMPPCVEGPQSWDTVGVHQSGIEPSRSASVAPPAELERPCETSSNAIERHQAIRSTPDGERASVRRQNQTQHERRQVENNDEEGKLAALVEMVGKDPTKRRQELRSFIARARRKCPAEK